jgi:hypothetical protein
VLICRCAVVNIHESWVSTWFQASQPFGPFEYAETVLGTFHHNPTVRKLTPAQSGEKGDFYVMYMIGDDRSPPTGLVNRFDFLRMIFKSAVKFPFNHSGGCEN